MVDLIVCTVLQLMTKFQ